MGNHYHLLLENRRENLSVGIRQINATYAQYFKKNRNKLVIFGKIALNHGIYLMIPILFTLFKYLEPNLIEAKITQRVGEFRYTLLHDILRNKLRVCMKESFALQWFDSTSALLKSLDIKMTEEEFQKIEQFQKEVTAYKREPKKIMQKLEIKDYFTKDLSKSYERWFYTE